MVKCNSCPIASDDSDFGFCCNLGYAIISKRTIGQGGHMDNSYYSRECRLVKIVLLDGEIKPDEQSGK